MLLAVVGVLVLAAGSSAAEPTPATTPEPTPATTPEPTPASVVVPPRRPLAELRSPETSWPDVQREIVAAGDRVQWTPTSREVGDRTLYLLQVTDRSPMGALAANTGGLRVDHGWLRVLGASSKDFDGIDTWNKLDAVPPGVLTEGYLIVGHDVLGGVFAVNGGGLAGRPGSVNYFPPDSLGWDDLEITYSQWLMWALSGNIALFYEGQRWTGWEKDVAAMTSNQGMSIYPPLWAQAESMDGRSRKAIPLAELVSFHFYSAANLPKEGPVRTVPVE